MARPEKVKFVEDLTEKFKASQSIIFTNYRGLNVAEVTDLRFRLREAGVEYKVAKNTLTRFAVKNAEIDVEEEVLMGPTAIAFGVEDPVAPAKILLDFAKEKKALEIKGGILAGDFISAERVTALSKIPSREELLAKALGSMKAPINNFVGTLAAVPRKLLYALNAIKEQKEN